MKKKSVLALVFALMLLSGCAAPMPLDEEPGPVPQQTDGAPLVCVEYSSFSGSFPEDGSGRQVAGVAAMLVRNDSNRFLDYALVECQIGEGVGTFKVTGLPAGKSVWVLEQNGRTVTAGDAFQVTACEDYAYRDNALTQTDKLTVAVDGNRVTVTNVSQETLVNVCLYYKSTHTDGNYFGGITYMLAFDTLKPGQALQKQAGHFGENSQIVRYSFQIG